jgi:hypothetical protein
MVSALTPAARAEATNQAPAFAEVYDLIRAHLAGANDAELNRTAVQALVAVLGPRVMLTSNTVPATVAKGPVGRTTVYDKSIAYLRIESVGDGLASAVGAVCDRLGQSNHLAGIVLDLRYAGGSDYSAATATADLFLKKERPLLDWGAGVVSSQAKTNAISLPVAVLVNRNTSGAAEALAAMLRQTDVALVLGGRTAGQAAIMQDYPLSTGQKLRIAVAPVKLGDGSTLSMQGIKPDIMVDVSPAEELSYFADAYRDSSSTNPSMGSLVSSNTMVSVTNRAGRRMRLNEAELVRERKEGILNDSDFSVEQESEPAEPVVRDPALARALDVLKGLALVRASHK